jgi:pyruvate dehydrogenase (quinone)
MSSECTRGACAACTVTRETAADRPTVIDVHTDPNVPPLPPHISFEQARAFLASMLKGDSDALSVMKASAREMMEAWFPGTRK